MPRVNRDLQRRLAARRGRERRRPPGERRYQFAPPEAEAADAVSEPSRLLDPAAHAPAVAVASATNVRAGRAARPFSAYRAEYAYVSRDLQRVGLVIGSLLAILIVLYFVLPH